MAVFMVSLLLVWGCSDTRSEAEVEQINIHLEDEGYSRLVDFLYEHAGKNRLTVSWFGWHQADPATKWYERSHEEPSNFKIKLELLTEENGSIFIYNHFDESIARLSIDYSDRKPEWLAVVEA